MKKIIANKILNFGRSFLLAVVSLVLLAGTSRAASIKFETRVPGYTQMGNGWVLVLPELRLVLSGKVRWDSARGCYVTDRVARTEKLRITISPTTSAERCQRIGLAGAYSDTGCYGWTIVPLPFATTGLVPANPSQDNVFVWTYTTSGYFEKRIPIGSR
jgi:hypothetical protein